MSEQKEVVGAEMALVLDVGSASFRMGLAGDDAPRAILSSHVGRLDADANAMDVDGSAGNCSYFYDLHKYRSGMRLDSVTKDGLIADWQILEKMWNHSIQNYVKVDPKEHPIIISEKPYSPTNFRYEMAQYMFETVSVPALFISKDSVLECYACGRTTGVVADVGYSGMYISSVIDGWVDPKTIALSSIGGQFLDAYTNSLLAKRIVGRPLTPAFQISKTIDKNNQIVSSISNTFNDVNPAYSTLMTLEIGKDLKERLCKTADSKFNETDPRYTAIPTSSYELPDGTAIDIGVERFLVPEVLIDPTSVDSISLFNDLAPLRDDFRILSKNKDGIARLIIDSVLHSETENHSSLFSSIVIAGGSSSFEGFADRVKAEVEDIVHLASPGMKIKSASVGNSERSFSAWLGGSILGSLSNFQEMWFSKQEYDEYGANLIDRKCP